MSLANTSLLNSLALANFWVTDDDIFLPNVTTQAGAYPVRGEVVRATQVFNNLPNLSMVLKPVLSGDAAPLTFVVNDSPQAIVVFCAPGEVLNGTLNGLLTIPGGVTTGQAGIFVRVPNNLGTAGWRAAVIP
jgi:hypothetical protein